MPEITRLPKTVTARPVVRADTHAARSSRATAGPLMRPCGLALAASIAANLPTATQALDLGPKKEMLAIIPTAIAVSTAAGIALSFATLAYFKPQWFALPPDVPHHEAGGGGPGRVLSAAYDSFRTEEATLIRNKLRSIGGPSRPPNFDNAKEQIMDAVDRLKLSDEEKSRMQEIFNFDSSQGTKDDITLVWNYLCRQNNQDRTDSFVRYLAGTKDCDNGRGEQALLFFTDSLNPELYKREEPDVLSELPPGDFRESEHVEAMRHLMMTAQKHAVEGYAVSVIPCGEKQDDLRNRRRVVITLLPDPAQPNIKVYDLAGKRVVDQALSTDIPTSLPSALVSKIDALKVKNHQKNDTAISKQDQREIAATLADVFGYKIEAGLPEELTKKEARAFLHDHYINGTPFAGDKSQKMTKAVFEQIFNKMWKGHARALGA